LGRLHELFLDVRVRGWKHNIPVHAELKALRWSLLGVYLMVWDSVGDGVFDAKPVLNTIVSKGYPL
jgi:hypothetical protein